MGLHPHFAVLRGAIQPAKVHPLRAADGPEGKHDLVERIAQPVGQRQFLLGLFYFAHHEGGILLA
jgi:hypothetical protein